MNLIHAIVIALSAFALGFVSIPYYIRVAQAKQIVDIPNQRSSHSTPTPRGGGIFICLGSILALLAQLLTSSSEISSWTCLLGSITMIAIGFVDDLVSLPSLLRLGGHVFGAVILLVGIIPFTHTNHTALLSAPIYWLSLFALVVWIVGSLNIYNFMDGIDGIATVQGIAASLAWIVISLSSGSTLGLTLSSSILGGLLAFLIFNWPPAKVFMGDGASGFLGYCFAALPLLLALPSAPDVWLKVNIGALCLFPFLSDGTYTLIRRAFNRENLLEAHRSHLYQRWHQANASHRAISLYYGFWACLSCGAALLAHFRLLGLPLAYAVAALPAVVPLIKSRQFPHKSNQ